MDLNETMKTAMSIAVTAGALLRKGYGRVSSLAMKSSAIDPVTEYDHASEALIIDRLRAAFPGHLLLAEEGSGDDAASAGAGETPTWIVDPLDGTVNFSHSYPVFAVSLGLWQGNEPLLGVVYDPLRDECFHATRGGGAWLAAGGEQRPLVASSAGELLHSLLATGFPYDRHSSELDNVAQFTAFLKRARGLRRSGSAALDLAYVAAGRLDGYWEYKLSSWDVAAGVLLVREAGGRVTTVGGQPFRLGSMVDLIASNAHIHQSIQEILAMVAERAG